MHELSGLFVLNFIYLFMAMRSLWCYTGTSLVVTSEDSSSSWCFSCCWAQVLGPVGVSGCGSQALEHRLNSCGTRASLPLRYVGSSRTRDRTRVSCTGRHILYWVAREAWSFGLECFLMLFLSFFMHTGVLFFFKFIFWYFHLIVLCTELSVCMIHFLLKWLVIFALCPGM